MKKEFLNIQSYRSLKVIADLKFFFDRICVLMNSPKTEIKLFLDVLVTKEVPKFEKCFIYPADLQHTNGLGNRRSIHLSYEGLN